MIQDTSAMDRPVARRWTSGRTLLWGIPLVAALVAAAVFLPSFVRWLNADRSVDASRLRMGTVVRGDLERDVSVQGRIVAAFHPTLLSPADGSVTLRVRAGDVVRAGQVLAVVASPELQNRLEQERSSVESQESELGRQRIEAKRTRLTNQQEIDLAGVEVEATRRAMDRAERSREEGILNDVEYEEAQDALRRAELELAHARQSARLVDETLDFELRNRELELERQKLALVDVERQVSELSLRAPVDGRVSRVDVGDRDVVTRNQAMLAVVDLSAFETEIQIPQNYVDEIGADTLVEITYEGERYPGAIRSIAPEVQANQVSARVAFSDGAPSGLRQNQRVSARLVLQSKNDVLKVPRGPFLEAGGGHEAYVINGDFADLRRIRTGAVSVREVEVISGLEIGEQIVVSDTARFANAERVYLRR